MFILDARLKGTVSNVLDSNQRSSETATEFRKSMTIGWTAGYLGNEDLMSRYIRSHI